MQYDLTNCDIEPIHIPGRIQSHGFLIVTNADDTIVYLSENSAAFLNIPVEGLLNKPVEIIEPTLNIGGGVSGFIRQLTRLSSQGSNTYHVELSGRDFDLTITSSEEVRLLEFEPKESSLAEEIQSLVGRSLSEILSDRNLDSLLGKTASQIRQIIGYDRVMVYKFHDDEHGEVVAESREEKLPSWLGLHYPASDIPKQARELYKINLIRLIADVQAETSPILTTEQNAKPLDLTNSVLRAVSPLHIQYLKNMGVASSFSISILDNGKLWGLIACHNYTPRFLNSKQRESAKLVGQVLSSAISFRQQELDQTNFSKIKSSLETITRYLLRTQPIEEALTSHPTNMLDIVKSSGAAFVSNNEVFSCGQVPESGFVFSLINFVENNIGFSELFQHNSLPKLFPEAIEFRHLASGVILCRLSKELKEYLIWFRPEIDATIKWAGNPEKPVDIGANGMLDISPRKSFEVWTEEVKYSSAPWTTSDARMAIALKDEVSFAISRRADELRMVNERLKEAYSELDTFSYTISHDLKNPLAVIRSYSQIILNRFDLEPQLKQMVERMQNRAFNMQDMIDEVLKYSKVGKEELHQAEIDMNALISEIKMDLAVSSINPNLIINVLNTPNIYGDITMIKQVFSNVMGNAVKYSSLKEFPLVTVDAVVSDTKIQYAVSDNGIGIQSSDQEQVFDLFSRASSAQEFEGTGVGLAITKRIIEKHTGRIRLESQPGQGSTFYISFNKLI